MPVTLKEFQEDSDWRAAYWEALHGSFNWDRDEEDKPHPVDQVDLVFASSEGERDEEDWLAVLRLIDGRWCVLRAGCDYTGWDCQAGGDVSYFDTVDAACSCLSLSRRERERLVGDLAIQAQGPAVTLDWNTDAPMDAAEAGNI